MKLNITFDEKLFDCFRRGDFATEEKIGNAVDAFLKGVKTIYVGNGVNIDVGGLSLMSSFNTIYTNCENRSDEHLLMEMDGNNATTDVVPRSFFNLREQKSPASIGGEMNARYFLMIFLLICT